MGYRSAFADGRSSESYGPVDLGGARRPAALADELDGAQARSPLRGRSGKSQVGRSSGSEHWLIWYLRKNGMSGHGQPISKGRYVLLHHSDEVTVAASIILFIGFCGTEVNTSTALRLARSEQDQPHSLSSVLMRF